MKSADERTTMLTHTEDRRIRRKLRAVGIFLNLAVDSIQCHTPKGDLSFFCMHCNKGEEAFCWDGTLEDALENGCPNCNGRAPKKVFRKGLRYNDATLNEALQVLGVVVVAGTYKGVKKPFTVECIVCGDQRTFTKANDLMNKAKMWEKRGWAITTGKFHCHKCRKVSRIK